MVERKRAARKSSPAVPSKGGILFRDDKEYVRRSMGILDTVGNLRLVGETGTGKSTLVHFLTHQNDWELHEYSLTTDTSRWDLLAQDILMPDPSQPGVTRTEARLGVVARWLIGYKHPEKKQVLFLDEFNYAQPSIMTIMNSLTDFRKEVWVPELMGSPLLDDPDNPMLMRTPNHMVIIGMNPSEKAGYAGTFAMNIAQLRRFESLELDYLSEKAELEVLDNQSPGLDFATSMRLIKLANLTREHYKQGELSVPITTGNLINYGHLLTKAAFDIEDVYGVMRAMYPPAEHGILDNLLKKSSEPRA
jgi:MoxR-like ATPase